MSPPFRYISFIVLFLFSISVVAQEKPFFTTKEFDFSESHRQNICARHNKFYRKEVELRNALDGMELHPLITVSRLFPLRDGVIDPANPGIITHLLDELGLRAGFEWRNSYAVSYGPGEDRSYTDLLVWATETYDFAADWWFNTVERLKLGIVFPAGFYDASFILVGRKEESNLGRGRAVLFSWLKAFHPSVWWVIIITILLSAVILVVLENLNSEGGNEWFWIRNIFFSFMLFTQQFEFMPKSPAARMFAVSLAFWSLIIGATYTANLSSFFVIQNTPPAINSIQDAIEAGHSMCLWKGDGQAIWVQNRYPEGIYVEKPNGEELMHGVKNGDCDFALTTVQAWQQYERDISLNGNCDLTWVGRVMLKVPLQ